MPRNQAGQRNPYTVQTLHQKLLDLLANEQVHLELTNLRQADALVTWDELFPPTNIRIKVDANAGQHIASVVHELLHVTLYETFLGRLGATLEEVCVVALENYLNAYIMKSPARIARWTALIESKLPQIDDPFDPSRVEREE